MEMKLDTGEEKRTFVMKYMKSKRLEVEKTLWTIVAISSQGQRPNYEASKA